MEKHENQQRSRINKAFEKIPRFDGTNPSYCFDWLEQTKALVHEHHGWIYREELLLNCGTSVSKTIHVEAIDIYKALGNETFYGLEENPDDQQEQQQQ